jgi:hypothetical protein
MGFSGGYTCKDFEGSAAPVLRDYGDRPGDKPLRQRREMGVRARDRRDRHGIRNLSGYPEGVMYAILFMNIFAASIDTAVISIKSRKEGAI